MLSLLSSLFIESKENVFNIKDFGAKGDGITNDYNAFQLASMTINNARGGILYIPEGNYLINTYISPKSKTKDITFKNLDSLKIIGNNAVINLKGDFCRKSNVKKKKKYTYSSIRSLIPLKIVNSKNILIEGLDIDGNVDQMTRDEGVVESSGHLIMITECSNIILRNLFLHHAMSDGIYINGKIRQTKKLLIDNICSENNARQGISIIALKDGVIKNSIFRKTGITNGNYGRHAPSAGVDIEPHSKNNGVNNVLFLNCTFENNLGSEAVINHVQSTRDIFFENCTFTSNDQTKRKWEIIVNARDITFNNCLFNLQNGSIYPTWKKNNTKATIKNSIINSGDCGILAVNYNDNSELYIENSKINYIGNTTISRFFPYIRMKQVEFINNEIFIPKEFLKNKGVDVLIQNSKRIKNLKLKSNNKITPRISTRNSIIEQ